MVALWTLGEIFDVCEVLTANGSWKERSDTVFCHTFFVISWNLVYTGAWIHWHTIQQLGGFPTTSDRTTISNLFVIESCLLTHWVWRRKPFSHGPSNPINFWHSTSCLSNGRQIAQSTPTGAWQSLGVQHLHRRRKKRKAGFRVLAQWNHKRKIWLWGQIHKGKSCKRVTVIKGPWRSKN